MDHKAEEVGLSISGLTWNNHKCCCGSRCGRSHDNCGSIIVKCLKVVTGDVVTFQIPRFCATVTNTRDSLDVSGLPNIIHRVENVTLFRLANNERLGRLGHGGGGSSLFKLLPINGGTQFVGGNPLTFMGKTLTFVTNSCRRNTCCDGDNYTQFY